MSLIDAYVDADGREVQPYYAAFMIERGHSRVSDLMEEGGSMMEYQLWNQSMLAKFKRQKGYPQTTTSPEQHKEFQMWLEERVTDAACRNHVEGIPASSWME